MAAKYTHFMHETGLSWNIDTDFPVILTFCLRRLDENDRNLYNYICICCQNERRQGAYFTKTRASAAQKEGSYFFNLSPLWRRTDYTSNYYNIYKPIHQENMHLCSNTVDWFIG